MNTEPAAVTEIEELRREVAYLRRMSENTIGRMLQVEIQAITMHQELEQKRQGFSLMAELAVGLGWDLTNDAFFASVSRRLNYALNMQRTIVLLPEADSGLFLPSVLQGYSKIDRQYLESRRLKIDPEFLNPLTPVLITGADPPERLADLRETLKLPFLISVPVMLRHELLALLVTGRMDEQRPFRPRLGLSDLETVRTVSTYLAALVAWRRLATVEDLANYDPLTNLPNLRRTKESLGQILSLAKRGGYKAAVLFIDLDNFKSVNDTYGHAAGDTVLHTVAERLRSCVRESDLVGRLGGDEFVAVISNLACPEDAGLVADKIIKKLSDPIHFHGVRCQVGASIGIAMFPDHGAEGSDLLATVDEAMYLVKKKGKNAFLIAGSAGKPET
jgi:diguanylate cyclase (GGDEF)-like protein